jgi:hypothetical protein
VPTTWASPAPQRTGRRSILIPVSSRAWKRFPAVNRSAVGSILSMLADSRSLRQHGERRAYRCRHLDRWRCRCWCHSTGLLRHRRWRGNRCRRGARHVTPAARPRPGEPGPQSAVLEWGGCGDHRRDRVFGVHAEGLRATQPPSRRDASSVHPPRSGGLMAGVEDVRVQGQTVDNGQGGVQVLTEAQITQLPQDIQARIAESWALLRNFFIVGNPKAP